MTQIYYIRHAEPNYNNHDDVGRELTARGKADSRLVTEFLLDKEIDMILSSPYRRAVDTLRHFAETIRMPIEHMADFRERKVDTGWIDDFDAFSRQQWADFDYHLPGGESLRQVQERNVAALEMLLREHAGKHIVIGGHGTAVSTLLNHYDPTFGHAQFEQIRRIMPWIARLDFDGTTFLGWEGFTVK